MGANKSKFLEIKSPSGNQFSDLTIDDLLDDSVLDKEFKNANFSQFINEDNNHDKDDETKFIRYKELFCRDALLNFTPPDITPDLPNLSTNRGKYKIYIFKW